MIQSKASTLGEKLARQGKQKPKGIFFAVLVVLMVFVSSWIAFKLTIIDENLFSLGVLLALFSGPIAYKSRSFLPEFSPNILFRYDHQHFMQDLNLSEKTAIIDGNNIYHFGLEAGFGVSVLSNIVLALRGEGYRIVCFFDANIYFTLRDNGAFEQGKGRFSIALLEQIFGLADNEIYVVPKGRQADDFIVESLSHLPVSFAVTNDRFRDFEARYDFLTKDDNWRKGLSIKGGELRLYQHKLKRPIFAKSHSS